MAFPKIWPSGLTNGLSTLDAAELEQLDTDHANSLDGKNGGTYAPTAIIVVGGEGIDHQYLANTTALKAVDTTSLIDGAVRWVTGLGRFMLDKTGAGASDTEDLPLVVEPTTGTGRWFATDQRAAAQYVVPFISPGTTSWVVPRNLAKALVEIVGGGAGGGGGTPASTTGNATGGGGGGGGNRFLGIANVTGGSTHSIIVGDGGAGGAAPSGNGGAGGDSSALGFVGTGGQASQGTAAVTSAVMVPGGVRGQGAVPLPAPFAVTGLSYLPVGPGDGGFSQTQGSATGHSAPGGTSLEGNDGGAAGANGTTSTGSGGVGGGGGGGGPGDGGGDGGTGGNGSASTGTAGSPGSDAPGASGAGGGGGGGGGTGGVTGGNGGNGGAGGSGFVTIHGYALSTANA